MKKTILALSTAASLISAPVLAEKHEIDMSDPTDAYTSLGVNYSNEGAGLKVTIMLSDPEADYKEIFLIEANDLFDEDNGDEPRFSGIGVCKNGEVSACFDDDTKNRNFRFRWGTIDKENGLGLTIDTVVQEHPFFGQMTIAQFGGLSTIPIGDDLIVWVLGLVGGVIVEDNMDKVVPTVGIPQADMVHGGLKLRSGGIDWASTVYSIKTYARQKFTDELWFLGSMSYTDEMKGKSWNEDIVDGGMELRPFQFEGILGYQLTPRQNICAKYLANIGDGSYDKVSLEYNYAF